MMRYKTVLSGVAGLFASSDNVSFREWHNYLNYLTLKTNHGGLEALGYADYVFGLQKENHIKQIRASLYDEYTIHPDVIRNEYLPIIYIKPASTFANSLGYDLFDIAEQDEAIIKARDSGEVIIGKYKADTKVLGSPDFLIYFPIYHHGFPIRTVNERHSALVGMLFGAFQLNDLMSDILDEHSNQITFKMYQVDANQATTFIYQATAEIDNNASHTAQRQLSLYGQTWLFEYSSRPSFNELFGSDMPIILLMGGIIVSCLLFLLAWSLVNAQHLFISLRQSKAHADKANTTLKQFKTILDLTIDSMFIFDPNTLTLLYFNQSVINEFGFSETELTQKFPRCLATDQQIDTLRQTIAPLLTGELRVFSQQGQIQHKTGAFIPVEIILQYIHEPNQTGHLVAIVRNISQQLQNEASLRKQEEILRCVINSIPQMVFWKDRDLRFLGCNQVVSQLANCQPSDLVGKTDYEMPWAADAAYYRRLDQEVMESNQAKLRFIETVMVEDGSIRWIETNKIPLHDIDNKVIGVLGTAEDITERLRAEQCLHKANEALLGREQQLRAIFESAGEAIIVINNQGIIESCNPAAEKMFGYSMDELINHNIKMIMLAEYAEKHDGYLQRYCETRERHIIGTRREVVGKRKDGVPVPLIISVGEFEIGNQQKFAGILHDISHLKQQQEELQQAKNAAEFANYAKSTFLANMSHELRTPLNGILGYAQILLRDDTLTLEQHGGLTTILRSGDYLLTLINDVLDLAKVEANKVEVLTVEFDFREFISSIVGLFTVRARQKNVMFEYQALTDLPKGVKADEKHLRQILLNLLSNAVKFTEQGKVVLKIGYDEQQHLRFSIEDTGIGIAQEEIEHIFKPFHQSGEQRFKAQGTGLGLTITKRLIEMLGSQLHVSSCLGKGSVFWFSLDLPCISTVTVKKTPAKILGYEGQRQRLLIIDTQPLNREILYKLLTPLGFEVFEATHDAEAIQQSLAIKPDLIFTSLGKTEAEGLEIVQQLRKLPDFVTMPIVAVSAHVFEYHQQMMKQAGCNAFLAQPIKEQELFAVLQTQLNLTWQYAISAQVAEKQDIATIFDINAPIPISAELADSLYNLAMMGDLNALFEKLNEMEQDEVLHPFVQYVREMVKEFQLDELASLVLPYVKPKN
ncbi:PAS domain S-box protein [Beggiatoa alba]|nr:PAS domain S-box protein [Beggiatoa alba]